MCTSPVKSYTNSRFIRTSIPSEFQISYPCGYCADCIRKKRSEWTLRAFYHSRRTFDRNGYVLFDTLTYSDQNLKYFHDIFPNHAYLSNDFDCMAFSIDDVQKFFKRLRTNICRGMTVRFADFIPFVSNSLAESYKKRKDIVLPAYPDVKDNLDFLLTCEYGSSDGCTHRPHYHILFFVTFDIPFDQLSLYIAASWLLGRTDGLPFKSRRYVHDDRLMSYNNPNNLKLTRYVTKYISKDMYLYRKLYKRVFRSYTIYDPDWMLSYHGRLAFRRFKNQVLPFHRQSQGFGLSALDYEDSSYIEDRGAIRMPISSSGVIASIPLPQYFRRKLYFDPKWILGKLSWIPNERYFVKKIKDFPRQVENLRNRLFSWDNSLGLEKATDIAKYQLLWRGMCVPRKLLDLSDGDMLRLRYSRNDLKYHCDERSSAVVFDEPVLFNNNVELAGYRCNRCISDIYVSNVVKNVRVGRFWSHQEFVKKPPEDLVVVSSETVSRYAGFDSILDDYDSWNQVLGFEKSFEMFHKDRMRDRYVQLGFLEF